MERASYILVFVHASTEESVTKYFLPGVSQYSCMRTVGIPGPNPGSALFSLCAIGSRMECESDIRLRSPGDPNLYIYTQQTAGLCTVVVRTACCVLRDDRITPIYLQYAAWPGIVSRASRECPGNFWRFSFHFFCSVRWGRDIGCGRRLWSFLLLSAVFRSCTLAVASYGKFSPSFDSSVVEHGVN